MDTVETSEKNDKSVKKAEEKNGKANPCEKRKDQIIVSLIVDKSESGDVSVKKAEDQKKASPRPNNRHSR